MSSSSNFPPQLHLSLPANATSFKRSFEQFGFDLESPSFVDSSGAASGSGTHSTPSPASDGNDRNKRARSSSRSIDSLQLAERSDSGATSSASHFERSAGALSATRPAILNTSTTSSSQSYIVNSFLEPPRLPTPDLPDVEMMDYQSEDPDSSLQFHPPTASANDRLRLSLDRFNDFDSQISVLRTSHPRSPSAIQSPSPPPTLPPLAISLDERGHLNGLPDSFTFAPAELSASSHPYLAFESSPSSPPGADTNVSDDNLSPHDTRARSSSESTRARSSSLFPFLSPASDTTPTNSPFHHHTEGTAINYTTSPQAQQRDDDTLFRDRLDSALDPMRSQSPLFSDFGDEASLRRTEGARFTPLPHIRTQVDEDRSWGVPWFSHSPGSPPDLPSQAETRFGPSRASASPTAPVLPPIAYSENRRDVSPRSSSFFGRMRRIERDIPARENPTTAPNRIRGSEYGPTLMSLLRADAYLAHLNDLRTPRLGNGSEARSLPWEDSGSDAARFIAHGLLDPNEETSRRSSETNTGSVGGTQVPALPRRSMERGRFTFADDRWDDPSNPEHEQIQRWPNTMRQAMQNRSSSVYDAIERWRAQPDSRELRRLSQPESPSAANSERSFGLNWRRRSSSISGPSRDQINESRFLPRLPQLELTAPYRRWSRSSANDRRTSDIPESRTEARPVFIDVGNADGASSSSSSDSEDGFVSIARWPLSLGSLEWDDHPNRETGSQPVTRTTRPQRGAPIQPDTQDPNYSWLHPPSTSRTDARDNQTLLSRLPWNSHRHSSTPRVTGSDRTSFANSQGGAFNISNSTESVRRNSTTSNNANPWAASTSTSRPDMTEPEPDIWSILSAAERSASVRDRRSHGRPATSPPRAATFSLPTPDFSPVFDSLPESMEASPPVSPQREFTTRAQGWRDLSANANDTMFRPPSPPPLVWEARPRQPSPLRLPMPRDMPRNSAIYRNIDLNAYQDSPFGASLQRFIELDRVRSRLSRLGTMATNEMAPGPSQPPSLPPLRFDYDLSPLNSNPPQAESASVPTSVQSRYSTGANSEHRMENSFEERHASARTQAADQHLQERSSQRLNPFFTETRTIPHAPAPSIPYRTRPASMEIPERRDSSIFSSMPRFGSRRTERDVAPRAQANEPDSSMDSISRLQQLVEDSRRPSNWERPINWGDYEGEAEPMRPSPWRRRFPRRSQEAPRPERQFPIIESSAPPSSARSAAGPTSRRRASSQSPVREDESIRDRIRFVARTGFRDFRMRFSAEEPFRLRNRFSGDYVRDEDFDSSYESLLSLAATLGEVKPRIVPEHVLSSLPTARYRDWVSTDSDKRCPICLDDYKFVDYVMKLTDCGHWLHRDCLKQWLRGASTCPVCRKNVRDPRQPSLNEDPGPSNRHHHHNEDEGHGRTIQEFFNFE